MNPLDSIISDRYSKSLALNLTHIHRAHPELIEAAFCSTSPIGWRRTLLNLKIDPYRIEHQLSEAVTCKLCQKQLGNMAAHIRSHNYTTQQYLDEFGQFSELSSDVFRADKFTGKLVESIPHWEKLWSPYYILDYVIAIHEAGLPTNSMFINKQLGIIDMASKWFGSWDNTLARAGISGSRLIPVTKQWSRIKVLKALKRLAEIRKGDPALKMTDALALAISRYFESTEVAISAAGLEPHEVYAKTVYSKQQLQDATEALHSVIQLKGKERKDRLNTVYHSHKALITGVYGSIIKMARALNLDESAVTTIIYRDELDVQHDLDLLQSQGKLLCFTEINEFSKTLYNVISKTGWGKDRLVRSGVVTPRFPKCNPRSGLVHDRLIVWRRKLYITKKEAAKLLGVSLDQYDRVEREQKPPSKKLEALIYEAFAQADLPYKPR